MDALFRPLSNNANDNSSGLAPPPGMRQGILPFLSVEINRTVFVVNIDSSTMMTDDRMLNLWEREWQDEGFNTFVLTMKDIMKHPRNQEFEEQVLSVPLN